MTLIERINEINAKGTNLVIDEDHWAARGVESAAQLDHYLAVVDFIDIYKEVNGSKPRMDFTILSTAEVKAMIDELIAELV
jgi:hypothetical protein